jgi:hypothetical protein
MWSEEHPQREEVTGTRGDEPAGRPVRPEPQNRRRLGSLAGQISVPDSFFEPLPEEDLRLWEGG